MKNHLNFKTSLKTCCFCLLCLASFYTAEAQNETPDSMPRVRKEELYSRPQPTEAAETGTNTAPGTVTGSQAPINQQSPKQSPMEFSQENLLKNLQSIDEWVYWSVGGVLLVLILIATLCRKGSERRDKENTYKARVPEVTQAAPQIAPQKQEEEQKIQREELPTLCVVPPPSCRKPELQAEKRVLAILEEPATGRSWNITETRTDIGRGSKNDICLDDNSVSSVHCALKLDQDGVWTLIDLNSTNHIYANGQIITSLELRHNTEFELGKIKLKFKIC